jgi:S1-C subfamily serine protease
MKDNDAMLSQIDELLFVTVHIRARGMGTGFLVSWEEEGKGRQHFVVTNKHVLHEDPAYRKALDRIELHMNRRGPKGELERLGGTIRLTHGGGSPRVVEHPDPDTDVLAVHITDVIMAADPEVRTLGFDHLADEKAMREREIRVGEDIITLGYPLGLKQGGSNLPLVRQGIIATDPAGVLEDEISDPSGEQRLRRRRAFLIDGATIPGASGSPVLLKPGATREVGGRQMYGGPPVVLGIVARGAAVPMGVDEDTAAAWHGLGLAFRSDTIRETIEQFYA